MQMEDAVTLKMIPTSILVYGYADWEPAAQ